MKNDNVPKKTLISSIEDRISAMELAAVTVSHTCRSCHWVVSDLRSTDFDMKNVCNPQGNFGSFSLIRIPFIKNEPVINLLNVLSAMINTDKNTEIWTLFFVRSTRRVNEVACLRTLFSQIRQVPKVDMYFNPPTFSANI